MSKPRVQWDEDKADENQRKHAVGFFEALDDTARLYHQDHLRTTRHSAGTT